VTPHRRRWRHGGRGTQHTDAKTAVEIKLRVRGALVAHRGCSGSLGDDGERPEWSGHVRAAVAVLRPELGTETSGAEARGEKTVNSGGSRGARG
jgi:hypothetical protein